MNITHRLAAVAAAALMSLGVVAPAFAADATSSHDFTINAGTEFSIEVLRSTNFSPVSFNLTDPQQWNAGNGSFDYKVTDLRGTGEGWVVTANSDGFVNKDTNVPVDGESLTATNNTQWATGLPAGLVSGTDFRYETGAVGVGAVSTVNSGSILGGRTLMSASAGTPGNIPNGTGVFYQEQAVYLYFPPAIAAGTYQATVTLTLTGSNLP